MYWVHSKPYLVVIGSCSHRVVKVFLLKKNCKTILLRHWRHGKVSCGLYNKHITIVNDVSEVTRRWRSKLWHHSDNSRGVIYDHTIFLFILLVINNAPRNIYSIGITHDYCHLGLSYFYNTGHRSVYTLVSFNQASITFASAALQGAPRSWAQALLANIRLAWKKNWLRRVSMPRFSATSATEKKVF